MASEKIDSIIKKAAERLQKAEAALNQYLNANKPENSPKYIELHREVDAAKDALTVAKKKSGA